MEKTVIELFAGVGGFRVGLNDVKEFDEEGRAIENGDWKFVWANQYEPSTHNQDAFHCYQVRFGSEDVSNLDIALVPRKDIPKHSLLVGGFPCQDYSVARTKSNEKGIEGKKGVLFWEIVDIADKKKTPFLLLENVDRLLKSPALQRGRDFGIMLKKFDELNYNLEWRVINAADYGCAQKRRRVFIFAWKQRSKYNRSLNIKSKDSLLEKQSFFAKCFPIDLEASKDYDGRIINLRGYKDTVQVSEEFKFGFENSGIMINGEVYTKKVVPQYEKPITLRNIREIDDDLSDYYLSTVQKNKLEKLKDRNRKKRKKPNGEIYYYSEGKMSFPDDLDLPGRTMLTSESSVNRSTHVLKDFRTDNLRFLTPKEAERLQSFPDNWTATGMSEKRRYFMMGNALVTKLINRMEKNLSEIISNE